MLQASFDVCAAVPSRKYRVCLMGCPSGPSGESNISKVLPSGIDPMPSNVLHQGTTAVELSEKLRYTACGAGVAVRVTVGAGEGDLLGAITLPRRPPLTMATAPITAATIVAIPRSTCRLAFAGP